MLRVWFELESTTARIIAARRGVTEAVALLTDAPAPSSGAPAATRPAALDDALAPGLAQARFDDYVVIDANGRIVVPGKWTGAAVRLAPQDRAILEDIFARTPRLLDGPSFESAPGAAEESPT